MPAANYKQKFVAIQYTGNNVAAILAVLNPPPEPIRWDAFTSPDNDRLILSWRTNTHNLAPFEVKVSEWVVSYPGEVNGDPSMSSFQVVTNEAFQRTYSAL